MSPIKIFIADDHQIIIDGIKGSLAMYDDLLYAGQAADEQELFSRLNNNIDVLLLDVLGEEHECLKMIQKIKSEHPTIHIIVLSINKNYSFAQKVIEYGARGFISKNIGLSDIFNTIRSIVKLPSQTVIILPDPDPTDEEREQVKASLTPRQLQVISLLCKGCKNNEEIADFLTKINKRTIGAEGVKTHRRDIRTRLKKFGVTNDASLGYWIAKWDLLDGSELSSTED